MKTRASFVLVLGLGAVIGVAQEPMVPEFVLNFRYGYEVNTREYPQNTPREAVKSVVKALESQRYNYLMSHLAEPKWVDQRVGQLKREVRASVEPGQSYLAFDLLVRETEKHFLGDPALLRDLRKFASLETEWDQGEDVAAGTLMALAGRQVRLRKWGDRWFLENPQQKR